MYRTAESALRPEGNGPGLKLAVLSHVEVSCSLYRFRPGQDNWKIWEGRRQGKHSQAWSEERWEESRCTSHGSHSGAYTDLYCCTIVPLLFQCWICDTDACILLYRRRYRHTDRYTDACNLWYRRTDCAVSKSSKFITFDYSQSVRLYHKMHASV